VINTNSFLAPNDICLGSGKRAIGAAATIYNFDGLTNFKNRSQIKYPSDEQAISNTAAGCRTQRKIYSIK